MLSFSREISFHEFQSSPADLFFFCLPQLALKVVNLRQISSYDLRLKRHSSSMAFADASSFVFVDLGQNSCKRVAFAEDKVILIPERLEEMQ